MILEPILPTVLSVRRLPHADPALVRAYGGDPARHIALGLITCDQDDPTYVALDEATKHAPIDVIFAKSFYAGAAHASGRLSGEILGVIAAAADPESIDQALEAIVRCLAHDACFYDADGKRTVAVFPHVISSLGEYLAKQAGLAPGEPMAYLVAPPIEASIGLDAALKAADVRAVRIVPPPTETNFACAWLTGTLDDCEAAAVAYAAAVVDVAAAPNTLGIAMIKNRTAILALLTGLNLLNYLDRMVVAAVLAPMRAPVADGGLDFSKAAAGILPTLFLLGYFLTAPWFGARADKGARKGLIAAGVAIWSLATFASGLATTFNQLVIARVIVGVGEASYATLAPTIIDDITPPEQKGRALAIFYLAIPVGSALGYVVGGFIQAQWGWRYAFFICGGPGILLALLCLAIAEPPRVLREAKGKLIDGLRTMAKLPLFRRSVLGYCAYTAGIAAFAYWAPSFIAERFYRNIYSLEEATKHADFNIGVVTVVAGALGTIIGGRWADRVQRKMPKITPDTKFDSHENKLGSNALLRICGVTMVIAAPLTAACFLMPTAPTFFACAFVTEFWLFLSTSPVNALGLRTVPPELRASAMAGMIFAIHLFGDLWSPTLLGILNDHLPATIAMMAVAVAFAISAYVWWPRAREAE